MNHDDTAPTLLIPECVTEITVTRSETIPGDVRVIAQGKRWTVSFWTTEEDVLKDLADTTARLEETQGTRS